MKTRFHEKLENLEGHYYEVFGDLEAQTEFLKLLTLILLVFVFLSSAAAFILVRRAPLVIRVTEVGQAEAIRDLKLNNSPSETESLYFAKSFVKRFSEYNAYTLARDMAEAMNQMTARYQRIAKRDLLESGLLARVKEAGLNSEIQFKEETLERNTPDHAIVSLIGVRTLTSYKNPSYRESSLFKAEVVLKKFQRSRDIPSGLLVEDYREMVLNKLEGTK